MYANRILAQFAQKTARMPPTKANRQQGALTRKAAKFVEKPCAGAFCDVQKRLRKFAVVFVQQRFRQRERAYTVYADVAAVKGIRPSVQNRRGNLYRSADDGYLSAPQAVSSAGDHARAVGDISRGYAVFRDRACRERFGNAVRRRDVLYYREICSAAFGTVSAQRMDENGIIKRSKNLLALFEIRSYKRMKAKNLS